MKQFLTALKLIPVALFFNFFVLLFSPSVFAQLGGSWTSVNSLPASGRAAAVQFVIDKTAYIGTGLNFGGGSSNLKDFWAYDPVNDVWTQLADFGGGKRSGAVAFAIAGKGYVMTGSGGAQKKNDLWEYDPSSDSWTQKNSLPGAARNYSVAFAIGSKGYCGTGFTNSDNLNDFWQYDPVNDSWIQKADVPGLPRSSAIGFSIEGVGYLGTGYTLNQVNDFYKYDTLTDTWTELSSVGTDARSDAAAFVINGHGFICSGSGITENLHDLLEYDPANDTWTAREPLPGSSKSDAVAFSIDGKGYFGSGSDEQFNQTTDFYEYTPDTAVATSANLISTNQKLQILPDPIIDQGMIIFQSDENVAAMKTQIFTEEGKEISSSHLQRQTSGEHEVRFIFSRDKLPKGIYLVFIKSNNQLLASAKMLIQ